MPSPSRAPKAALIETLLLATAITILLLMAPTALHAATLASP
jgi:hypothetical protein